MRVSRRHRDRDRHRRIGRNVTREQCGRFARQLQLLISANRENAHARFRRRDIDHWPIGCESHIAITVLIEYRTQKVEPLACTMAHQRTVLTDSTGEGDDVHATHHGDIGADVLANTMRIDRDGAAAVFIALCGAPFNGRKIDGARKAHQA